MISRLRPSDAEASTQTAPVHHPILAASIIALVLAPAGCEPLGSWDDAYIYHCSGECGICVGPIVNGQCTEWEIKEVADVLEVCGVDAEDAYDLCVEALEEAVIEAYDGIAMDDCAIVAGPTLSGETCSQDEYYAPPTVMPSKLRTDLMSVSSVSSTAVVVEGGETDSISVSGTLHFVPDPAHFSLVSMHLTGASSATHGGTVYSGLYAWHMRKLPIEGTRETNGDFSIPMGSISYLGGWKEGGTQKLGMFTVDDTLIDGHFNETNDTWSADWSWVDGSTSATVHLVGTIANHRPNADFSFGSQSSCHVAVTSTSTDDDSDAMEYVWYVNGTAKDDGQTASLPLGPGNNSVKLIVNDDNGAVSAPKIRTITRTNCP